MADYLLLYSGGHMPETDAERAEVMAAWDRWFHALGSAVKDGGNPFSGQAKTIESGGSVSNDGGSASGYSVITADSLDDAVAKAKDCPVLLGGAKITVYETFEVM